MKVRTLRATLWICTAILLLALAGSAIAGLFERPFRLSGYIYHLLLPAMFIALAPTWFRQLHKRQAELGLDGEIPGWPGRARLIALGVGLMALMAGLIVVLLVNRPR